MYIKKSAGDICNRQMVREKENSERGKNIYKRQSKTSEKEKIVREKKARETEARKGETEERKGETARWRVYEVNEFEQEQFPNIFTLANRVFIYILRTKLKPLIQQISLSMTNLQTTS